jgi:pyridinium-3,5-biscarboxylic acid mononucleotide synthase
MSDVVDDLLGELTGLEAAVGDHGRAVRADVGRERRKGVPEVVLADRKRPEDALAAVRAFLEARGRAILSRVPPELAERIGREHADCRIEAYPASGMLVVKRAGFVPPPPGGCVGVLTAGTSDVPIAEQAQVIASEMGSRVLTAYDVGVAGLHRLAGPLRQFRAAGVDALVVAAGMDGALPSVVAGLVDVPVIGLPTSVGYGVGGRGLAALLSMLQTCAPGLVVVNIDNGVGAGATAALIANRVAAAGRAAAGGGASQA